MAIPLFLAARSGESVVFPEHYAWMACPFSDRGLAVLPRRLPKGSMVVLTDEIPPREQDPLAVAAQLAERSYPALLLDFQRPDCRQTNRMAEVIAANCPFPVGITEHYAGDLNCPVFLAPIPPDQQIEAHLKRWQGREIWLDLSPSPTRITVTENGSRSEHLPAIPVPVHIHRQQELFCHYGIEVQQDCIIFELWRTKEDLAGLLDAVKPLGVTRAIGLYQELGDW